MPPLLPSKRDLPRALPPAADNRLAEPQRVGRPKSHQLDKEIRTLG